MTEMWCVLLLLLIVQTPFIWQSLTNAEHLSKTKQFQGEKLNF